MRLEHLCDFRGAFTAVFPLVRPFGGEEGGAYAEGEGQFTGERLSGSARWSNFPHRRSDGAMLPNLSGILTTPDGARALFHFTGLTTWPGGPGGPGNQRLFVTFMSDDERYRWLNDAVCVLEGRMDPVIGPGRSSLGEAHIYLLVNELMG